MTPRKPPGQTWQSFVEEQIQSAMAAGAFDNLPGFGKPLASLDEPLDDDWWLKQKARLEDLSLLPPALAVRLEVHQTRERIWNLGTESAVRDAVAQLNAKIRQANLDAVWGPPVTTLPLDVEAVVAEWRERKER